MSVSPQRQECEDACVRMQAGLLPFLLLIHTHTRTAPFCNIVFLVPESRPQVLQLLLHLHLRAGIHPQTHRLWFSPLLQRQVRRVFESCVGGVTMFQVPAVLEPVPAATGKQNTHRAG